jgi:hypothetical protein
LLGLAPKQCARAAGDFEDQATLVAASNIAKAAADIAAIAPSFSGGGCTLAFIPEWVFCAERQEGDGFLFGFEDEGAGPFVRLKQDGNVRQAKYGRIIDHVLSYGAAHSFPVFPHGPILWQQVGARTLS